MSAHPPTELRNILTYPKSTLVLLSVSITTLVYIYFFYPAFHFVNTGFTYSYGQLVETSQTETIRTLAGWTWDACNAKNGYLHGRIIPLLSASMLIHAWHRNRDRPIASSYWGLITLLIGLLFFYAGARAIQPRWALFGAPFVIIGLSHYLFGRTIAKATLFPAFFLWFAIPIPGLAAYFCNFLAVHSHSTAVNIGQLVGMELTTSGSTIFIGESQMDTARSVGERLTWFLVISASIYANFSQRILWTKILLFLSIVPILILAYASRLLLILALVHFNQEDIAKKTYHDWAGLLVIIPTFLGLFLLSLLFKKTLRPYQPKPFEE